MNMSNITIENCDTGTVELHGGVFRDDTLYFSAADTFVPGTILARRKVATAVTAAAGTNSGSGTCTAASVIGGPVVPMVGAYTLRCTEAVTNGGVFRLEDPNGMIVASSLRMTAGSGQATVFKVAGLTFTLTDANDFAVGDTFTLTVAADGKLVPFASDGVGGAQIPAAVLTYEASKASSGNLAVRTLVGGQVRKERLIIDADGTNANVNTTVVEQLREIGIVAISSTELAGLDNQ